jgi:hypothetical protein
VTVFGGDIIYAADINAILAVQPVAYAKASSTARNTTTTYAADPELTGIPLAVGSYEIELILFWTQTTTATQKVKTRWIFSGTWNNTVRAVIGAGSNNTAAPGNVAESQISAYRADDQDAVYCQAAGGTFGIVREISRNVVVTVAGDLSLHWAQSASSGNNTTVHAGTVFQVRKTA